MNDTPRANRVQIALFGRTNSGKSSVINAMTRQNLALVSDVAGTTTDPVLKSMEILPLGPVVLIDTAGLDDTSPLGELRIRKSMAVLDKTDIVVLVVDANQGLTALEIGFINDLQKRNLPFLILFNKSDILTTPVFECAHPHVFVSAMTRQNIDVALTLLGNMLPKTKDTFRLVGDLVSAGDVVVLVTPIDPSAPKGRLILPQQQVIRDLLESDCVTMVVKEHELKLALESLRTPPKLVITDSQVFLKVASDTPKSIPLTSFSILFARYKGELEQFVKGVKAIDRLQDGDVILIAEGCTHHVSCDDIGTVKLPRWIRNYTGKNLTFESVSGSSFPTDLSPYAMVLMCGSCMLTQRDVRHRMSKVSDLNLPLVNYGMAIAHVQGILRRSLSMFPHLLHLYDE